MEKNRPVKQNGSSAFFWGLVVGALLATLLTTKNGRKILHELVDILLSMMEDFKEKKKIETMPVVSKVKNAVNDFKNEVEFEKAVDDIKSEIAEDEEPASSEPEFEDRAVTPVQVMTEETDVVIEEKEASKPNGHSKKRLFHGIRKAK